MKACLLPVEKGQNYRILLSPLTCIRVGNAQAGANSRKHTTQLVNAIKACDSEWYPTTSEIIQSINDDFENEGFRDIHSVLDCGAGDGRVLEKLKINNKYAIEKSKPLLDAMSRDIFIVGTEFAEQVLIDKKVDVVFSNPPYSEFEKWAIKIISQANARHVYPNYA